MIKNYCELYKEMHSNFYPNGKKKFNKDLCTFLPMCGDEYYTQDIRLLVYGRAVNGWDVFKNDSDQDTYIEHLREYYEKHENEKKECGFWWITTKGDGHYYNNTGKFSMNRSSFWRVISKIYKQLTNNFDDCFFKYIAWSNLYKIAPLEGGNPNSKMCKCQCDCCKKILKEEINMYKPTHILFITGMDWFKDFIDNSFMDINEIDNNIIEGEGTCSLFENNKIKIIIASRPEGLKGIGIEEK